ncbi:unnamed protein product [Haemonchus placei]|uniref:Uncharacterized protein n=1 Tax=Haemonchus placei TaxID=6290 RepID=A0A0N4W5D5_HAEPC|nr:unnamed protein product [Haemonchus placei]
MNEHFAPVAALLAAFQADATKKSDVSGRTRPENADTYVLVDAEDEKHSAPFHSLSKSEEDKTRNGILTNSGETKTRRRATDPRPLRKELKKVLVFPVYDICIHCIEPKATIKLDCSLL